jgi:pimeloyl-ACP methyl ester carboxylesterase
MRRALAMMLAVAGLAVMAAPAGAQAPGVSPPGANDFGCRSAAHPVPVILVHGTFGDMTVSWNLVSPALKNAGFCVFALDLVKRGMAPIDQSADKLAAFIDEVRQRTGAAKVSLVGHSQGGMLGRYVARYRNKLSVIEDIVGLAPSSHGTTNPLAPHVAGLGCAACAEQAAGSAFMEKLNAGEEAPPPQSYTVVSTRYDQVVTPYRSQALAGSTVTNVVLQDRCPEDVTDHVGIIYDPIALAWTLNALGRSGPADPAFVPPCSDGAGESVPFAFPAARRPRVQGDRARVRVSCSGSVGRCVGRLILRDRKGKLGSRAVDLPVGRARTLSVALRRAPKRRVTARMVTLQPGGWVSASLRYTLRRKNSG